jgi:hypothetical protein
MKDRMTRSTRLNDHQWDGSHAQEILFILFILSNRCVLCASARDVEKHIDPGMNEPQCW